jgi:putative transposase
MDLGDSGDRFRFLILDRASKFTTAFGAVFTGADMRIIRTPIRAPRAIAIAAPGMPRPPTDHRTTPPRHRAARVRAAFSTHTDHTGHSINAHPLRRDRLEGLIHAYVQVA